jgi:hypothetical protein
MMKKIIEQHSKRLPVSVPLSALNKPAIAYYKKLGADVTHTEMNCELKTNSPFKKPAHLRCKSQ